MSRQSTLFTLAVSECSIRWCGVVWCGVVWCGVVWCGVSLPLTRPIVRSPFMHNSAHCSCIHINDGESLDQDNRVIKATLSLSDVLDVCQAHTSLAQAVSAKLAINILWCRFRQTLWIS